MKSTVVIFLMALCAFPLVDKCSGQAAVVRGESAEPVTNGVSRNVRQTDGFVPSASLLPVISQPLSVEVAGPEAELSTDGLTRKLRSSSFDNDEVDDVDDDDEDDDDVNSEGPQARFFKLHKKKHFVQQLLGGGHGCRGYGCGGHHGLHSHGHNQGYFGGHNHGFHGHNHGYYDGHNHGLYGGHNHGPYGGYGGYNQGYYGGYQQGPYPGYGGYNQGFYPSHSHGPYGGYNQGFHGHNPYDGFFRNQGRSAASASSGSLNDSPLGGSSQSQAKANSASFKLGPLSASISSAKSSANQRQDTIRGFNY